MKINVVLLTFILSFLCLIHISISTSTTTISTFQSYAMIKATTKIESTFRNQVLSSTKTLTNPLRLFKLRSEKQILAKVRYMFEKGQLLWVPMTLIILTIKCLI